MNLLKKAPFFLKFLATGGLNTLFGYLAFSFFTLITQSPTIAVVLATIAGVLFNFKTYKTFVFVSKGNSRLLRFCAAYLLYTIIQVSALKILNSMGITNPYLGGAILSLPMAVLSFIMLKKFVFRQIPIEDTAAQPIK